MSSWIGVRVLAAICTIGAVSAVAYGPGDLRKDRSLPIYTNEFVEYTGLPPTVSNLVHILIAPVDTYSNYPSSPATARRLAYDNQIVASLRILDMTGAATQHHDLVEERIMLCVQSNAANSRVLRWCAKVLVESELEAQTGLRILRSIVTNDHARTIDRLSSAGDLANYDQPAGYSLMLGALTGSNRFEKVIAENALLMYIQYVQRHSSPAATQQLLTADGECIDLGAVEKAVTNGFRLPFMSSLLTNVATRIRELREQGSPPQP